MIVIHYSNQKEKKRKKNQMIITIKIEKHVKNFYTENHKILLTQTKEDLRKQRKKLCSGIGRQYWKAIKICNFNVNTLKTPDVFISSL